MTSSNDRLDWDTVNDPLRATLTTKMDLNIDHTRPVTSPPAVSINIRRSNRFASDGTVLSYRWLGSTSSVRTSAVMRDKMQNAK